MPYSALLSLLLSGCVTSTVAQLAGGPGTPSHQADHVVAAYQMPDGNIVLFVKGRIHGVKGESDFSLLLPRVEIEKLKTEHESTRGEDRIFRYAATIGPSIAYMSEGWRPLAIARKATEVNSHAILAASEPVLYELPRALTADNGNGLRKYWGNVELIYVEPYADNGSFRLDIAPKAQWVKGNASKWIPVAVAADIVTLPAQAMWAALFIGTMAGVATAESNH